MGGSSAYTTGGRLGPAGKGAADVAPHTGWATTAGAGRWTVQVHGELDIDTGPRLREYLAGELDRCAEPQFAVDLTGVVFCDSSGLQALTAARKRAQGLDRHLLLVMQENSRTHRLLEVAGLLEAFDIEGPDLGIGPRVGGHANGRG